MHQNSEAGDDFLNDSDCTDCGEPYNAAALPATNCLDCHAYPPADATGLVQSPATGSTSAGMHQLHVDYYIPLFGEEEVCSICHTGGMSETPLAVNLSDGLIQIGFDQTQFPTTGREQFDGRSTLLNGYQYSGTNGAVVNENDKWRCYNVYCHSPAKIISMGFEMDSYSPRWDGSEPDRNGGTKCDNCHGFPPRFDSHLSHTEGIGYTCNICHYATVAADGVTILNQSVHVNGVYDVVPAPGQYYRGRWQDRLEFSYEPAGGGGVCANNFCHYYYRRPLTMNWTIADPLIDATPVVQESCPDGDSFIGITFNVAFNASLELPYICTIDWGDNTVTEEIDCTSQQITHSYTDNLLDHTVTWTLHDQLWSSTQQQTTFVPRTCPIVDKPPVANAGGDRMAVVSSTVNFDGSGSTDEYGITLYEWDFGSDGTYEFTGVTVSKVYNFIGTFSVTLRVTDSIGQTNTDTVLVTITDADQPPVANAGIDQLVATGATVNFDGSGSTDDYGITLYEWDFESDGIYDATGVNASTIYSIAGSYTVTLRITDTIGLTDTDMAVVTVVDDNLPVADAGIDQSVLTGATVNFDGSGSTDDYGITLYEWDFESDGIYDATGVNASTIYYIAGSFTATLRVTDTIGRTAADVAVVTVIRDTVPIAYAGVNQSVTTGVTVNFNGGGSTDDYGITLWEWDFESDGIYDATGVNAATVYNIAGNYTVTLRVTDTIGQTDTDTAIVTVILDNLPVADAGIDQSVTTSATVNFDGSGSTDDYGIMLYEWDFESDGIYDATGVNASTVYSIAGSYTVTLRVRDTVGRTATDITVVTVVVDTVPVANAGIDQSVTAGATVNFSGSGSTDDVGIALYQWDFESDGTYDFTGVNASTVYSTAGSYTVTLRVTDTLGQTDTDIAVMTVIVDTIPVADAGIDQSVAAGSTVNFDGSGSTDDFGITLYEWDFASDGTYDRTGANVSMVYNFPGTYSVTLRVTDTIGQTATDIVLVTIY